MVLDEKKGATSPKTSTIKLINLLTVLGITAPYRIILLSGRATYLHVRKRKLGLQVTGEIFSYEWDISKFDEHKA